MPTDDMIIYGYFENDTDEGRLELPLTENAGLLDGDTVVNLLVDLYDASPQFIQDQVSVLGVVVNDVDVDIIEISDGRKIKNS